MCTNEWPSIYLFIITFIQSFIVRTTVSPPPLLTISNSTVERVICFKLLGINICNDLRWDAHVDALCSKVASRLYFLKLLKRSGLSANDLLCFYKSVICSVLEYGSVV